METVPAGSEGLIEAALKPAKVRSKSS